MIPILTFVVCLPALPPPPFPPPPPPLPGPRLAHELEVVLPSPGRRRGRREGPEEQSKKRPSYPSSSFVFVRCCGCCSLRRWRLHRRRTWTVTDLRSSPYRQRLSASARWGWFASTPAHQLPRPTPWVRGGGGSKRAGAWLSVLLFSNRPPSHHPLPPAAAAPLPRPPNPAAGKPLVMEEFGFARDGGSLSPNATTSARDAMYAALFKEVIASANTMGALAGAEFWAWAGAGRPAGYEVRGGRGGGSEALLPVPGAVGRNCTISCPEAAAAPAAPPRLSRPIRLCGGRAAGPSQAASSVPLAQRVPADPSDVCAPTPPDMQSFTGKPAQWSACFASEEARPDACPLQTWWCGTIGRGRHDASSTAAAAPVNGLCCARAYRPAGALPPRRTSEDSRLGSGIRLTSLKGGTGATTLPAAAAPAIPPPPAPPPLRYLHRSRMFSILVLAVHG